MCASAIESALKAKLELEESDKITTPEGGRRPYEWRDLHNRVKNEFGYGKSWFEGMKILFDRRNSIIHYGCAPDDEKDATRVLLEHGYPLLSNYYIGLFDFYLDWHDLSVNRSLSETNAKRDVRNALVPDISDLWHSSKEIFSKAKKIEGLDMWYCFYGLLSRIQQMTSRLSIDEYESELFHDLCDEYEAKKKRIRCAFNDDCWNFDCPVCFSDSGEKFIVEFDDNKFEEGVFGFSRAECIRCGFSVNQPDKMPHLLDILLQKQVNESGEKIMSYWKQGS